MAKIATMGVKVVSILIVMGFAIGAHVDQDSAELDARSALPQPSWVDLGPVPFGGLPRRGDIVARAITPTYTSADSTKRRKFSVRLSRTPAGYHTHYSRRRCRAACTSAHIIWRRVFERKAWR